MLVLKTRAAPPRIARTLGGVFVVVGACAGASPAWALPTPDLVVGVANVFPLLAGMVLAACTGVYLALNRRLGAERGSFVAGALVGFLLLASVLAVLGIRSAIRSREERRIADLAIYLRCDYAAHEVIAERRRAPGAEAWDTIGQFEVTTMAEAEERFAKEPDAALLATYRWEIEYHSGIPAFDIDGKLHLFEFVRRSDLTKRLETVTARDVYLVDFTSYLAPPERFPGAKEVFRKFRRIHIVDDVPDGDRYVREGDSVLRADASTKAVAWPVREEDWLIDEKHVLFPGFTRLLDDDESARLLRDESTYVIAPFDGTYRTPDVYGDEYLGVVLSGVEPSRRLIVDLAAPDLAVRLDAIARRLDRRAFVVVGISKYDYVYHGLEFSHAMWRRLGRDPDRFRLKGFTTRLPEAVARNWIDQSRRGTLDFLHEPFGRVVGALQAAFGVPAGAAFLLFGALLKFVVSPIGLLEARARFLRKRIESRERTTPGPWRGSGAVLLRKLRGLRAFELAGTMLTLLLLLPAYRLITASDLASGSFLWIEDLSGGDPAVSAIAAALVLVKLLADGSARAPVAVSAAVAFGWLLLFVPAAVLLYATGVLAVGAIQDLVARFHGRRVLARALLGAQ